MYIIDNVLIPRELIKTTFQCRYQECGGACCVAGELGAPILREEILRIEQQFSEIQTAMDSDMMKYCQHHPLFVFTNDAWSIQCFQDNGRCIFSTLETSTVRCILEKFKDRDTHRSLRPISCQLFPIRIRQVGTFWLLDHEEWEECVHSWDAPVPLLAFSMDALSLRFGAEWVNRLVALLQSLQ